MQSLSRLFSFPQGEIDKAYVITHGCLSWHVVLTKHAFVHRETSRGPEYRIVAGRDFDWHIRPHLTRDLEIQIESLSLHADLLSRWALFCCLGDNTVTRRSLKPGQTAGKRTMQVLGTRRANIP